MIIETGGKHYLYCLRPERFVSVPAFDVTSQATCYTATPTPIEVTVDADGTFAFRTDTTAEKGYLCASPHLTDKPVCQWTPTGNGSRWRLRTCPEVFGGIHLKRALLMINPLDYNFDGRISISDIPHGIVRGVAKDQIEAVESIIIRR